MRHQAREIALQILFQTEFTSQISYEDFLSLFEQQFSRDEINYAEFLISGVKNHQERIDATLQATSSKWSLSRMSFVDRNILRIAIFEMKFASELLKPNIAINEAVELAKKYGTVDSSSFVNGILDAIAKGT